MNIYAFGTHSDWYYGGGAWGKPGLQRISDYCRESGISRLYWRTHNGGQAKYPSKVCSNADSSGYRDPDFKGFGTLPKSYFTYMTYADYSKWDQLGDMAEIACQSGIEYCHWYTVFEDDHGGHLASDFIRAHPEFLCRTRDGEPVSGCPDFWFPEVREYKLGIIKELLAKPASRLLLDFLRRNGKPSADVAGNYRYGYNPEKIAAFKAETGFDALAIEPGTPEWDAWLAFNARPVTEFVLEVVGLARQAGISLDLLVWPVDLLKWMAFDLPALARAGAVEEIMVGSHTYSYAPEEVHRQLTAIAPQVAGTSAVVVPGLPAYHDLPGEGFEGFAAEAEAQGCDTIVLFESDAVLRNPISDRMRAVSIGKSYRSRAVTATRIKGIQGTQGAPDWSCLPVHTGFLRTFVQDDGRTDQETSFQIAHDGETLYVRYICKERSPEKLGEVPCFDRNNYNIHQLGSRLFWDPFESVHLMLDYRHQHDDYVRFMVDPANGSIAGERIADGWPHPWKHSATIASDRWEAEMAIPLKTLGLENPSGKVLGFQLVRVQDQPREVSTWFNSKGRRMSPGDFGHLTLE